MRKTKIICTLGPACSDEKTIASMVRAGMNTARLNFSHGTHEDHLKRINIVRKVSEELGVPVAIMLDTKGPEYRIKCFENGKVTLTDGADFIFTVDDIIGDENRVSVTYKGLAGELVPGDRILLNNGMLVFEVKSTDSKNIYCRVITGGELSDNKSMSFPGKVMNQEYLSDQDKNDLLFGIENDVDFIACSFTSRKQDLLDVKDFLAQHGANGIELIAKIENQSGVDNIEDICSECDGIMVARGDMGVEVPFEQLPSIQKMLISKCSMLGKRVITATEMLESMIHNPRPTRAEASDVANAVFDGTSAIMLSGETAAGKYPVRAVETMACIAQSAEDNICYESLFNGHEFKIRNIVDAISHATCGMSIDIGAKVIAVCTLSGMTARMVSRFRSPVDILALTTDEKTCRKLALSWGVTPVMCDTYDSTDVLFYTAKKLAQKTFKLAKGDRIIITGGMTNGTSGNTNMLKVETIV
ncbi:MAG: pyruvate kinase [Clostridia bacterium]|nr:pyruvate kinase [Clostridia bacterium]